MRYLNAGEIATTNIFQIMNYSPDEQIGVKDSRALDRAVNQPQEVIFDRELSPNIAEKVAILMIHLIKKHPFFNANKLTAMMAADIFCRCMDMIVHFLSMRGLRLFYASRVVMTNSSII